MSTNAITNNTLIPIGAVIAVLSAVFSYGIMYQKVNSLELQVANLNQSVVQLTKEVNRLIGSQNLTYER